MSADTETNRSRRRLLTLLLVGVIVLLGAGIGTITMFDSNGVPDDSVGAGPTDQGANVQTMEQNDEETGVPTVEATESPHDETTEEETEATTPEHTDQKSESATKVSEHPTEPSTTTAKTTDGDRGNDSTDQVTVSLGAPNNTTLLNTGTPVPGHSETETLELKNNGDEAGYLRLAKTTVVDYENGIVEPEAAVDSSPDEGELSTVLEVKMTFHYPDGTARTVVGSDDSFVTLTSMNASSQPDVVVPPGETVTVELAWRIPESAGNEIQSDTVTFDAVFELRAQKLEPQENSKNRFIPVMRSPTIIRSSGGP